MNIRILDERRDEGLLREAWAWASDAPEWFREVQSAHKESLGEFLKTAHEELIVGIFENEKVVAVVRFVPQMFGETGLHELHLMAKRKTDFNSLFQACASIKQFVAERGLIKLGGWIAKKNRPIVKLYEMLGFKHHGDMRTEGTIHGKPAIWLFYET